MQAAVHVRIAATIAAFALLAAPLVGCTFPGGGERTQSPAPTVSCPDEQGGSCRGELAPGTYTTIELDPSVTYTVPGEGWTNTEDRAGGFVLLAPGTTAEDLRSGADADLVAIIPDVLPVAGPCDFAPAEGVPATPQAYVDRLSAEPAYAVTPPRPVEVGGLDGLAIDISLRADAAPSCLDDPEWAPVLLGIDEDGTAAATGATPRSLTRFYLLARGDGVLLVEIDATTPGSAIVEDLTAVVEGLEIEPLTPNA
ncbi:hypothetical protein [Naasia sp. SYSU D00057]|uniref:hypothetical protein n=1 Tax=Naasia sp. SYSU D00057 TaxID=2817380 RepID=UPI001B30033D|nr:hypothetical protein [Naasia sp. SYSU D00057]